MSNDTNNGFSGKILITIVIVMLSASMTNNAIGQINGKIGIGFGAPYGYLGTGLELDVTKHVTVLGGLGLAFLPNPPWATGLRCYFQKPEKKVRFHLTGVYWQEGIGLYAGLDYDGKKEGGLVWTFGLGYGDVNLSGPIGAKIGIAYRFSFFSDKEEK